MPDFKIVVSDPQAPKSEKRVKVKVEGDSELPLTDKIKEKFELMPIKMNSKTAEEIKAVHGVATIRIRRPDTGDVTKMTGKIIIDNNLPDFVVKVPLEILVNATGLTEAEGEIFRARAWQIRVNDERTSSLIGLKIGDVFEGSILGLKGVKLKITGGSDISGFPMRPDIHGPVKKRVLLSGPPGYYPKKKGERRRKIVRGNTIAPDIVQINTMIVY